MITVIIDLSFLSESELVGCDFAYSRQSLRCYHVNSDTGATQIIWGRTPSRLSDSGSRCFCVLCRLWTVLDI